jgi:hypothetical protein
LDEKTRVKSGLDAYHRRMMHDRLKREEALACDQMAILKREEWLKKCQKSEFKWSGDHYSPWQYICSQPTQIIKSYQTIKSSLPRHIYKALIHWMPAITDWSCETCGIRTKWSVVCEKCDKDLQCQYIRCRITTSWKPGRCKIHNEDYFTAQIESDVFMLCWLASRRLGIEPLSTLPRDIAKLLSKRLLSGVFPRWKYDNLDIATWWLQTSWSF